MPQIKDRMQNLDGHVVIIDPTFDGGTPWDIPTFDQLKRVQRLAEWQKKQKNSEYEGLFNAPSLARELRFKTSLAFLQPFIESGIALGIYADKVLRFIP